MEYQVYLGEKEIQFEIAVSATDFIDQLAFVHLVTAKFNAHERSAQCWGSGKNRRYVFAIVFPDWESCSQAEAHCDRNVSPGGEVVSDYRGALDYADPGRKMANAMKERAELAE